MHLSISTWAMPVLLLLLTIGCGEDHTEGVTAATVTYLPAEATPSAEPSASRTTLPIDLATSTLGFTGAKVSGSHDGTFTRFSGNIELDTANVTASSVNVSIEIASMTIEPARLAQHLLTADFFDATTYPTAAFTSSTVTEGGTGTVGDIAVTHTITGDLTVHGQTHHITFPAVIDVVDGAVRARAEFSINRRDFGIEYPGMPDDLIRDEVVVRFDVRAHG